RRSHGRIGPEPGRAGSEAEGGAFVTAFWSDRRVLVTGGAGFLGSFLTERLKRESPAALLTPKKNELNLLDVAAVRAYLNAHRPNLVLHAAAVVGGIGANRLHPRSEEHTSELQ